MPDWTGASGSSPAAAWSARSTRRAARCTPAAARREDRQLVRRRRDRRRVHRQRPRAVPLRRPTQRCAAGRPGGSATTVDPRRSRASSRRAPARRRRCSARTCVAITDNADPRMNVAGLQHGRQRRDSCAAQPVFARARATPRTPSSRVGDSVIVENNYGYTGPAIDRRQATTARASPASTSTRRHVHAWPGPATRSRPHRCRRCRWRTGCSTSTPSRRRRRSTPGTSRRSTSAPGTPRSASSPAPVRGYNNHYAAIYLGPDGSAYIPTLTGMVRVHDTG